MVTAALVLFFALSVLVGLCGRRRRMGFLGFFFLSLLITPVLALLLVFLTEEIPSRAVASPPAPPVPQPVPLPQSPPPPEPELRSAG